MSEIYLRQWFHIVGYYVHKGFSYKDLRGQTFLFLRAKFYIFIYLFICLFVFLGPPPPQHVEVPRLGSNWSYSRRPTPQPRQIWAESVTYTTANGNTHWARPGIKPVSSWMLVRLISTEPLLELLCFGNFIYGYQIFLITCIVLFCFLFFLVFWGPNPWHMEIPRLSV